MSEKTIYIPQLKKYFIANNCPPNYNSNTKDHQNQYNNNEKVWNIVRISNVWHRDRKWANDVGKMAPKDLLNAGLPQTFNL